MGGTASHITTLRSEKTESRFSVRLEDRAERQGFDPGNNCKHHVKDGKSSYLDVPIEQMKKGASDGCEHLRRSESKNNVVPLHQQSQHWVRLNVSSKEHDALIRRHPIGHLNDDKQGDSCIADKFGQFHGGSDLQLQKCNPRARIEL